MKIHEFADKYRSDLGHATANALKYSSWCDDDVSKFNLLHPSEVSRLRGVGRVGLKNLFLTLADEGIYIHSNSNGSINPDEPTKNYIKQLLIRYY